MKIEYDFIMFASAGTGSLVARALMVRPELHNPFLNVFSRWFGYACLIIAALMFAVDNGVI